MDAIVRRRETGQGNGARNPGTRQALLAACVGLARLTGETVMVNHALSLATSPSCWPYVFPELEDLEALPEIRITPTLRAFAVRCAAFDRCATCGAAHLPGRHSASACELNLAWDERMNGW